MSARLALVVLALGASALVVPAALASPATSCAVAFSGHGNTYSLDACTGVLTYPAHTGPQWVIVTGPTNSGSAFGPTWLPQSGGTMAVTITGCGGQVDVRSTKARTQGGHIAGRQFHVPNCGTPTPTETTPSPTTTSTTSHPSPSSSSSRPTTTLTSTTPSGPPSSAAPHKTPSGSSTPSSTLAATGSDLLPPTLAALGLIVAGLALTLRRKGTHR